MQSEWEGFRKSKDADFVSSPDTSVSIDTLKEVAKNIHGTSTRFSVLKDPTCWRNRRRW